MGITGDINQPEGLLDLSRAYLGIKTLGIFAPLSYFRSENDWGTGDLDTLSAVITFASRMNIGVIQILPLNVPISDNCPYAIASSYVFDPVYIGMATVIEQLAAAKKERYYEKAIHGIEKKAIEASSLRKEKTSTNEQTRLLKYDIMKLFFEGFINSEIKDKAEDLSGYLNGKTGTIPAGSSSLAISFIDYCVDNRNWLSDHLVYFIAAEEFGGYDFRKWPEEIAFREPSGLNALKSGNSEKILFEAFLQWILHNQILLRLKQGREARNPVDIMLDQPFAFGNADVWADMDAFLINRGNLKREFTQGAPPHRLDIPQHWQFYLLDPENAESRELLLRRLIFLLRYCSLLRIDHLLGYYQLYYMAEDTSWEITLEKLGIFHNIDSINKETCSPGEKRYKIYNIIIDALKKKIPEGIISQAFDREGNIKNGNVVLAARKGHAKIDSDRNITGWYSVNSSEHEEILSYCLISPNRFGGTDYLEKIISEKNEFLRPDDSIRLCFFNPGPGEETVSEFMRLAQEQGKTLVFENLGLVPEQVSRSLSELGAVEFKPLYFGYQYFTGDHNSYWLDKIRKCDYASFSIHDTVTVEGWWTGKGKWASAKYYFNNDEQKQGVINFLRLNNYLHEGEPALISELTPQMHRAVLDTVADSNADIAVIMMSDIFKSGEEGIINIPGQTGFWTARSLITIEELLKENPKGAGKKAVELLYYLLRRKNRFSLAKQLEETGSRMPMVTALHPEAGEGKKQIRFTGESFLIDAVTYGSFNKIEIFIENIGPVSMEEITPHSKVPENVRIFRAMIKAGSNFPLATPFHVLIDGNRATDNGYLINIPPMTDTNPLSGAYGRAKKTSGRAPEPYSREFFNLIFNSWLFRWFGKQRWYLMKNSRLERIAVNDLFELETGSRDERIFCLICEAKSEEGTGSYYLPLLISEFPLEDYKSLNPVKFSSGGCNFYITPAEHTLAYQKAQGFMFSDGRTAPTANGGMAIFRPSGKHGNNLFSFEASGARNLLQGSNDDSSNMLTEVKFGKITSVVKTIKTGASDIEMEMYETLSGESYPNMPVLYGNSYIEYQDSSRIPLSIVIEKISGPAGLSKENWKLKAGYIISHSMLISVEKFAENPGINDADVLINKMLRLKIKDIINPEGDINIPEKLDFSAFITKIGRAIGGFHAALGKSKNPGFRIEKGNMKTFHEKAIHGAVNFIEGQLNHITDKDFSKIFLGMKEALIDKADKFNMELPEINFSRIHGDMQADQILLNSKWELTLIDFGGAPILGPSERRAKGLAVSDVAGISRALGYIKFYVLCRLLEADSRTVFSILSGDADCYKNKKYKPSDAAAIVSFADKAEKTLAAMLAKSYLDFIEESHTEQIIMPHWDRYTAEALVNYAMKARALYEIGYEIAARPSEMWYYKPLDGIRS